MKKICFILLFGLFMISEAQALGRGRSFLKVDCIPELEIFEIRQLNFYRPYCNKKKQTAFWDKAEQDGSEEYKLLKDKYGIIREASSNLGQPIFDGNKLEKKCVLRGKEYTIIINILGLSIEQGDNVLVNDLYFSYNNTLYMWDIYSLTFDAKTEKFVIGERPYVGYPMMYFQYSPAKEGTLNPSMMDKKSKEVTKRYGKACPPSCEQVISVDGEEIYDTLPHEEHDYDCDTLEAETE